MKIFSLLAALLLTILIFNKADGQYTLKKGEPVSASFSEATPLKINSHYFFLYGLPARTYTSPEQFHPQKLKRYREASLLKYDVNFKLQSTVDLSNEFTDKIIEGAIVRNGNLYIVSSDKVETGKNFYISALNENGHINTKQTKLFTADNPTHGVYVCCNPDSSYNLVISLNDVSKKDAQTIDGSITDKNMNLVSSFNCALDFSEKDLFFLNFFLLDKNQFAIIYAVKGDKKNPASYFFISFDGKGKLLRKIEINTNENLIANPAFYQDKNQITFYGLAAKKGAKNFSGIAMGKISIPSGQTTAFSINDLQKTQTQKNVSEAAFKEISKNGIDKDFVLKKAFKMSDGTNSFVYENGGNSIYQSYFDAAHTNPSYQVNKFHHYDILVLKVDTLGNVIWLGLIPRHQVESDLTVCGGTVVTKDVKDGIHILFHDSEKNTATDPSDKVKIVEVTFPKRLSVAHVFITNTGQVKKDFLFSNDTDDEYLSPEYSVGYDNEILFSAAYTRVFKKSSYHFGVIRFK